MGMIINSYVFATGGGYDPDAQAFITAAGLTDTGQKDAINNLVLDLKSASLWSKLLAFYPFVGGTASSHKYNLLNPADTNAAYRLTFNGTVTHSSTGIRSTTGGYADTHWAPSSTLSIWERGSFGYYLQNDFTIATYDAPMGAVDGSDNRMCAFAIGSGTSLIDWGSSGALIRFGPGAGFMDDNYIVYTTGASDSITVKLNDNGSIVATGGGTVSGNKANPVTTNMNILKRTDCGGACDWNGTISSSFIGYQISDSEATSLSNIINTYQTALGRNTY